MKTSGYADLLDGIKARVRSAAAVNLQRQTEQGCGAKVVDRPAGDLMREFPGMRGFPPRNVAIIKSLGSLIYFR